MSPQNFYKKLVKTDAAVGGLEVLISAHYGTGFKLYEEIETEKGVDLKERLIRSFPDVHSFFKQVRWQIFISEIVADYETFNICYPEYLLSPDKSKVISVKRHQSAYCRLSIPDQKTGLINYVYINSDWENYDEDLTEKVQFFSPEVSVEEAKEYCKKRISKNL
nr:hypothetical protein BACY1_21000 [Tenacibaculum mesophilum]